MDALPGSSSGPMRHTRRSCRPPVASGGTLHIVVDSRRPVRPAHAERPCFCVNMICAIPCSSSFATKKSDEEAMPRLEAVDLRRAAAPSSANTGVGIDYR